MHVERIQDFQKYIIKDQKSALITFDSAVSDIGGVGASVGRQIPLQTSSSKERAQAFTNGNDLQPSTKKVEYANDQ